MPYRSKNKRKQQIINNESEFNRNIAEDLRYRDKITINHLLKNVKAKPEFGTNLILIEIIKMYMLNTKSLMMKTDGGEIIK